MKSYIKIILAMLIYGTIGILAKLIPLQSTQIILMRTLIGSITLFILALIKGEKLDTKSIDKNKYRLILSGILMSATWILLFQSYKYIDVSIGVLIHYLAPVIIILTSPFVFKEKLNKNKIIGVILAMIGMILVNGAVAKGENIRLGIIYGLIAASLYAILLILNKSMENISALIMTLIQMLIAFITTLIYMTIMNQLPFSLPKGEGLIALIILGVFPTGIACYLHFSALQELPAQTSALISYIDPVAAIIFASIILGERLSIVQLIGGGLILFGAAYGEISSLNNKRL